MFKKNWNEEKISLIFLSSFSAIISFFIIYINCNFNTLTGVDVYLYLMYSLKFAGFNVGYDYVIPNLSPLIPFLNSLVFRLGFIGEDSIIIITGLFYIIGVISSYFLFKLRFNNLISTLGAFLFGNFFIILFSIGNGNLDIPSISLCILAMYLIFSKEYNNTINNNFNNFNNFNNNNNNNIAINNNFNNTNKNNSNNKNNQKNSYIQNIKINKCFYLGFIVLALGFLAKFTALLLIMVVLIYFLSKRDFKKNFKKYTQMLFLGFLFFALTIIPYVIYLALNYDNPLAFLSYADAMGLAEIKPEFFYQVFFYFERIPYIIYSPNLNFAYVLIALILVGMIIAGVKFIFYLKNKNKAIHRNNINNSKYKIKNNKYDGINSKYNSINSKHDRINSKYDSVNSKYNIKNIIKIKSEKSYKLLLILSIAILIFSFFLTYIATWKFTEILVFLGILIFVYGFNHSKSKNKSFNLDLTIFSWFFIYLIFFTTRITKGDRYFISFMPPFIFICLYFIDTFSKELNGLKAKLLKNIYVNNPKDYLKIKKLIKHEILIKWLNFRKIIPIFIIILFLFSTISYLSINRHESIIDNEKDTVIWLKNYDTDYMDKVIVSDSPFYTFYMRKEVSLLTKDVNTSNIGSFLKNKNVSYFISNLNYSNHVKGYKIIKTIGKVSIYLQE
ncbi:MAG: glycosyltransferase family 39 protein [Methanobrevibacter sp.]|jgi:4-amino-4-deoxy-L-arabinose transferase-like glycosyltransferase|nr:glycosyltransferase family 39 protein [Methanobrevibacter sp.]